MLCVVDIGNTDIKIGFFTGESFKGPFRMTTKPQRTSDEYGLFIRDIFNYHEMQEKKVEGVIISSVVPNIMYSFTSAMRKYIHKEPMIVSPDMETGLKFAMDHPREVGADKIADATAAYTICGGPVIVIDFGTANKYDLILEDGSYVAGVISPGIQIAANALTERAAKLPGIEIRKPETVLAKNTVDSMQAGLVYGYIGQTEYIIQKMIEESGLSHVKVIATGGLGKIIADETDLIHTYDPNLTLKGLKLLYEKNKNRKKA